MRSLLLSMAYCFVFVGAVAQKLPNKQNASLVAPLNVKIDGNLAEWGELQAYNHATDIAYSIANDDKNLYFIVKAENQAVLTKIINGGITLAISKSGKQGKPDVTITYPVFEKGEKPALNINKAMIEKGGIDSDVPAADVQQTNNNFAAKSKLIMITGIAGIDTLLSVYNEYNIKVAVRFDNHMAYNCELAIPLSKLALPADKFAYHIILNGESWLVGKGLSTSSPATGQNDVVEAKLAAEQSQLGRNTAPTDFWAEYTLTKK